ncbi:hypothetical protein [Shewanella psychrotolerans]|uniref:hypothetical protein n=1 Tax=Shewanella psychrotolerans TaxID=2864206 RepID=UPI001C661666|nr:hypothetical protein [Shewanella psychrotolerans]QYK01279.1 hypothetical protein K0I62_18300 [Shewanella psychrotolerans]
MKKWFILLSCGAFVVASMFTTGMVRALVDLIAFAAIFGLVWSMQDSTEVNDIK